MKTQKEDFFGLRYMRCGPVSRQHGLERGGVDRTARARDSLETNPAPPPLPHRAWRSYFAKLRTHPDGKGTHTHIYPETLLDTHANEE